MEELSKVEVVPREVTEPDGLVFLDDARHSNRDGLDARKHEINADLLEKIFVKDVLIRDGCEADRVKYVAVFTDERDDGFGAANVDTEIHVFSIASLAREGNNR